MPPKPAHDFPTATTAPPNLLRPILRLPGVLSASGDTKSTHYLKISQGLWTKPVRLGARAVGWPSDEVASLINARIAGKSNEEIRDLVKQLESARGAGTRVKGLSDSAQRKD